LMKPQDILAALDHVEIVDFSKAADV
jgi:hypothetical protein